MRTILASIFLLVLMCSCKKDDSDILPPISEVPAIELWSTGPSSVVALEDSIIFVLHYIDGDGDLGFNDPDSMSLYVTDNRIGLTQEMFVPLLAPEDASVSIQGELEIELQNCIMTDPDATSETVTYTLRLRDRSGNWSNSVTSPPIIVTPN